MGQFSDLKPTIGHFRSVAPANKRGALHRRGIAGVNFAANGIMGQTWKYTYDGAGRLTLALREDSLPGTPLYGQDRFTYDRNGNILSLTNKLGTDSLTVAAPRTGNRLTAATYDANGNETSCTTEGTLSIVYNRLNLPERIVLSGNDTVRYWYSAAGVKLRENTTDYSGSLVIKNGTLDKLLVPTGYVAANGNITSNGQYVYFVKDHLGSIRATVAQNGTVLERYWFGPYGDDVPAPGQTTVQTSTTDNPYRFSGKERTPADYDFGARRYLPFRVPRWTAMDPMAEKYFPITPYAYCAGDPVNYWDPEGKQDFAIGIEMGLASGTPWGIVIGGLITVGCILYEIIISTDDSNDNDSSIEQSRNPVFDWQSKRDREAADEEERIKIQHKESANNSFGDPDNHDDNNDFNIRNPKKKGVALITGILALIKQCSNNDTSNTEQIIQKPTEQVLLQSNPSNKPNNKDKNEN